MAEVSGRRLEQIQRFKFLGILSQPQNKRKLVQWIVPLFVLVVGVLTTTLARADGEPTGYWTTIHDDGKTEKSVVEIINERGTLRGRVVRLINPPIPNPPCQNCSGAHKDKPIIGLQFLWGLKQDGNEWSGGRILDPETGKEYRCFIEVIDGGKRLKVRGYMGIALFGRTQYWNRAKAPGNK